MELSKPLGAERRQSTSTTQLYNNTHTVQSHNLTMNNHYLWHNKLHRSHIVSHKLQNKNKTHSQHAQQIMCLTLRTICKRYRGVAQTHWATVWSRGSCTFPGSVQQAGAYAAQLPRTWGVSPELAALIHVLRARRCSLVKVLVVLCETYFIIKCIHELYRRVRIKGTLLLLLYNYMISENQSWQT